MVIELISVGTEILLGNITNTNARYLAEECAVPYPTSRGFQEWADVIWNELVPAYSLEVSMEDACKKIAEQMDKILEDHN